MSSGWLSIYLVLIGIGEKREQIWCKMGGKREQKAQREREVEVNEFPLSAHEYFSTVVNSSKKEVRGLCAQYSLFCNCCTICRLLEKKAIRLRRAQHVTPLVNKSNLAF